METSPRVMQKMVILFPKVPVYVKGPVAPLFREWADIAEAYERNPTSLHAAWLYLGHHPAFWTIYERADGFQVASGGGWYQSIEMGVSEEGVSEEGPVWLEIRPSLWPDDAEPEGALSLIEVEAPTYEEAVREAARKVHDQYRNDREFLTAPLTDKWY